MEGSESVTLAKGSGSRRPKTYGSDPVSDFSTNDYEERAPIRLLSVYFLYNVIFFLHKTFQKVESLKMRFVIFSVTK